MFSLLRFWSSSIGYQLKFTFVKLVLVDVGHEWFELVVYSLDTFDLFDFGFRAKELVKC